MAPPMSKSCLTGVVSAVKEKLWLWITRIHDRECYSAEIGGYRQLGSQISRFHVDCEIGTPVRIGYSQAKFVITRAT